MNLKQLRLLGKNKIPRKIKAAAIPRLQKEISRYKFSKQLLLDRKCALISDNLTKLELLQKYRSRKLGCLAQAERTARYIHEQIEKTQLQLVSHLLIAIHCAVILAPTAFADNGRALISIDDTTKLAIGLSIAGVVTSITLIGGISYLMGSPLEKAVNTIGKKVNECTSESSDCVKKHASELITEVNGSIKGQLTDVKGHASELITEVNGSIKGQLTDVKGHTSELLTEINGSIKEQLTDVKGHTSELLTEINGSIKEQLTDVKGHTSELLKEFDGSLGKRITDVKDSLNPVAHAQTISAGGAKIVKKMCRAILQLTRNQSPIEEGGAGQDADSTTGSVVHITRQEAELAQLRYELSIKDPNLVSDNPNLPGSPTAPMPTTYVPSAPVPITSEPIMSVPITSVPIAPTVSEVGSPTAGTVPSSPTLAATGINLQGSGGSHASSIVEPLLISVGALGYVAYILVLLGLYVLSVRVAFSVQLLGFHYFIWVPYVEAFYYRYKAAQQYKQF